mgnify:FL=1
MLEVAFRTDLEDFLLDVDVFGSGDVTVISSCCFWELLSLNVFFREMTVKALNYERERQSGFIGDGSKDYDDEEPDANEVDEYFQFQMGWLRADFLEIKNDSVYKDMDLNILEYEDFVFALNMFLESYIEELQEDLNIRIKELHLRGNLMVVVID